MWKFKALAAVIQPNLLSRRAAWANFGRKITRMRRPEPPNFATRARPAPGQRHFMGHRGDHARALRALAGASLLAMALGAAAWPTATANAQSRPSQNPSVIIDFSVLDQLGPAPAPSSPRLLQPGGQPPMRAIPRLPPSPPPALRTVPPAVPTATQGPIVLQPPAVDAPTVRPPSATKKKSTAKPAKRAWSA